MNLNTSYTEFINIIFYNMSVLMDSLKIVWVGILTRNVNQLKISHLMYILITVCSR